MIRNPWFWFTIIIIAGGVALVAALGALHWLIAAFAAAGLIVVIVFLFAAYDVGRTGWPEVLTAPRESSAATLPVLYDCDPTLGLPFRDVGDGLTLLYLLGEPRVELLAVTTTYGNGPVSMTTRVARRLVQVAGRDEVPVLPGAGFWDGDDHQSNRAARYLVETVNRRPGEVFLIATGALTNLRHALLLDPDFFAKLRGLYLMGGITEPLTWHGHRLAERNFSADPEAAYKAIHADCPVTIAPGRVGLTAVFRAPQFAALQKLEGTVPRFIARRIRFWFALNRLWFRDGGFGMWDSTAALALTYPGLFEHEMVYVTSTRADLRDGRLFTDPSRHGPVRLILRVRDYSGFIAAHFAAWQRLG